MATKDILKERQSTHGDFSDNARTAQQLKEVVRNSVGWETMNAVQKEATDMILHKIARATNGNASFKDHWDDIAGYATLVSDRV